MQSSLGNNSSSEQKLFAPFVAHTWKFEGHNGFYGFYDDFVSYSEKHKLIIICPINSSLQFYNAKTLLPSEEFESQMIDREVLAMSFCAETETLIFGCCHGRIYIYNLSNKALQKLEQPISEHIFEIIWTKPETYAFTVFRSSQIHIGNLANGDFFRFPPQKSEIYKLRSLPERNLLFSILDNGAIGIYRTNVLPKLPVLCSVQGGNDGARKLQCIKINGKDFIVTWGNSKRVEIWHFIKGTMRRLKVIKMPEEVLCVVYLENCKIFATIHGPQEIRFFRLFSGKLEWTLDVGLNQCLEGFLMKDKNTIGVLGSEQTLMKIVQLH